jgi:hypothetical protein
MGSIANTLMKHMKKMLMQIMNTGNIKNSNYKITGRVGAEKKANAELSCICWAKNEGMCR